MASKVTKQEVKAVKTTDTTTAPVLYVLGKAPRNGLNANTKHGSGGTAGTYAALKAALADKPGLPLADLQALCKSNGDAGFARYAIRNNWLMAAKADAK